MTGWSTLVVASAGSRCDDAGRFIAIRRGADPQHCGGSCAHGTAASREWRHRKSYQIVSLRRPPQQPDAAAVLIGTVCVTTRSEFSILTDLSLWTEGPIFVTLGHSSQYIPSRCERGSAGRVALLYLLGLDMHNSTRRWPGTTSSELAVNSSIDPAINASTDGSDISGGSTPGNDFDLFADQYRDEMLKAVSFSGADPDLFTRVKADDLLRLARSTLGITTQLGFLDIGCGVGSTDRFLVPHVDELHGIDISSACIARAKQSNPSVHYKAYEGGRLPYETGKFDLAFAICVFHHLQREERPFLLQEMKRVVRAGGLVCIYEHNPWNPLTLWVVRTCAFDRDAELITSHACRQLVRGVGLDVRTSRFILFFPHYGTLFRNAERLLSWIPFGAQYVVAGTVQ